MNCINRNKQLYRVIFLLSFVLSTSITLAQSNGKKITIQEKNISVKDAFSKIEQQTGYPKDDIN